MTKKIKLQASSRLIKKRVRRTGVVVRKACRFCGGAEQAAALDYKNAGLLRAFLTERGKVLPSRISGICSRHQRELAVTIKRARVLALLPYTGYQY